MFDLCSKIEWYWPWFDSFLVLRNNPALLVSLFPLPLWLLMGLLSLRFILAYPKITRRSRRFQTLIPDELSPVLLNVIALAVLLFVARMAWWMFTHSSIQGATDAAVVASILGLPSLGGLGTIFLDVQGLFAVGQRKRLLEH
jgi:hypothetical protein